MICFPRHAYHARYNVGAVIDICRGPHVVCLAGCDGDVEQYSILLARQVPRYLAGLTQIISMIDGIIMMSFSLISGVVHCGLG